MTYKEILTHMNYGTNYDFRGVLFRDRRRNTGTLYCEIHHLGKGIWTPTIRIGFDEFESSELQTQTRTVIKTSGECVSGIQARVFVPYQEVETYQIDLTIQGERYTQHWYPDYNKQNTQRAASSTAQPRPIDTLFEPSIQKVRATYNSTHLRQTLDDLGDV